MAVDPRITARRVAVRRAEGRRRLRFLMVALGLVGLAIGAWGLTRTPLLDLDHVRVDGVGAANAAEIEAAAALETGTPMFDLDLGSVERDLTALAWVEGATATRDWPGTILLTVQPRTAVAVVGPVGGDGFLADADAVLMRRTGEEPSSLPRVDIEPSVGLGEAEEGASDGIEVAMALPDDLRSWVEAITIEPGSGDEERAMLGLDLVGSARVRLGTVEFVADKLAALRAVLEGADLRCVEVIDVVVADLPTIVRAQSCEAGTGTEPADADA